MTRKKKVYLRMPACLVDRRHARSNGCTFPSRQHTAVEIRYAGHVNGCLEKSMGNKLRCDKNK